MNTLGDLPIGAIVLFPCSRTMYLGYVSHKDTESVYIQNISIDSQMALANCKSFNGLVYQIDLWHRNKFAANTPITKGTCYYAI